MRRALIGLVLALVACTGEAALLPTAELPPGTVVTVLQDAEFLGTSGLSVDPAGRLLAADRFQDLVVRYRADGPREVVAGAGAPGFPAVGEAGPAPAGPYDVAVDAAGRIYIADTGNALVRLIADGERRNLAGTGTPGVSGDGGPADQASLSFVTSVAVGPGGEVYIAESGAYRVRRVSFDGQITTVAGNGRKAGPGRPPGDGGPALAASLGDLAALATGADGTLYLIELVPSGDPAEPGDAGTGGEGAQQEGHRVRRVAPDGTIHTVAAAAARRGFGGDGGPAIDASFDGLTDVAVGADGSLLLADSQNHRVRRIGPDGTVTTIAGTGVAGFSGDGGPAEQAAFNRPTALALDAQGNLFISDNLNQRVRLVAGAADPAER